MQLVTAAEARRLDELTIGKYGTPGAVLMQRAGAGATRALLQQFPHARRGRVVVVCGKGNNGGDGFVIATLLRRRRVRVEAVLLTDPAELTGDAAQMYRLMREARVPVIAAAGGGDTARLADTLRDASLLVDAVLGTGLNAEVRGRYADAIYTMNASGIPIFAVDMPSGVHADTGRAMGVAVQAEATVTFGFAKIGQVIYPGIHSVGALAVVDIGIAPEAVAEVRPRTWLLERDAVRGLVPSRPAEAHKGTCGHVLIIAGSIGHTGAARIAAHAACRTGAGLTTLAGPASLNTVFSCGIPEVMTAPLLDEDGLIRFDEQRLSRLLDGKSAVVVGPGIGTHEDARRLLRFLLLQSSLPMVVDADALTCLAGEVELVRAATANIVMTPHPGEMARLIGGDTASVQADRLATARSFAERGHCALVLKGARSVIAAPDGSAWINPTGNPGMASGGMGDALAGMLGALLAQGLAPLDAARLGVFLHGDIADGLAAERGHIGLLASDVVERVPSALGRLQAEIGDAASRPVSASVRAGSGSGSRSHVRPSEHVRRPRGARQTHTE